MKFKTINETASVEPWRMCKNFQFTSLTVSIDLSDGYIVPLEKVTLK